MKFRHLATALALFTMNLLTFAEETATSKAELLAKVKQPLEDVQDLVFTVAAILAIIFLVVNGIRWMFADSPQSKEEAKRGLQAAIIGLVIIAIAKPLTQYLLP